VYSSDREVDFYQYTVVVARLPETLGLSRGLSVESRGRFDALKRVGDRLRGRRRIKLESAALAKSFTISDPGGGKRDFGAPGVHPRLHRLDGDKHPQALGFELEKGVLCVSIPREVLDCDYLEAFCRTASFIAARLLQEAG
jgi:hypothetical protein